MCKLAEGQNGVLIQLSIHLCYGFVTAHLAIVQALHILLHIALPVLYGLRMQLVSSARTPWLTP